MRNYIHVQEGKYYDLYFNTVKFVDIAFVSMCLYF